MKILIRFLTKEYKSEVISPFINLPECKANDNELVVPGVIKVDMSGAGLECYCLGVDVAEKILSSVCRVQVESTNNSGSVEFPPSLLGAILEAEIDDFDKVLELGSNGRVEFVDTDKKKLKVVVPLAQWLDADLLINYPKALVQFGFHNYEINVTDNSALQFCTRVKEHPILAASSLNKYLKLQDMKLNPSLEYITFWKILKSDNGYKRYSQFMNDMQDKIEVQYEHNRMYRCKFDGGKVDFQLESIGDKYPKKVVVQINEFNDIEILNSLKAALSLKTIELVAKVTSLNIPIMKLRSLGFSKHEDFFVFARVKDKFMAKYDIGSNTLSVKQDFNIDGAMDPDELQRAKDGLNTWIQEVMSYGE